jgi:rifampicin phosphotransferase
VVGTREATDRIADGVRVRVDGDAGTVTVLA